MNAVAKAAPRLLAGRPITDRLAHIIRSSGAMESAITAASKLHLSAQYPNHTAILRKQIVSCIMRANCTTICRGLSWHVGLGVGSLIRSFGDTNLPQSPLPRLIIFLSPCFSGYFYVFSFSWFCKYLL